MTRIILFWGIVLFPILALSQELTQTVRGSVIDTDSKQPLAGVQVIIVDSHPLKGSITNTNGDFRLEQVSIGRTTLQVSYGNARNCIDGN